MAPALSIGDCVRIPDGRIGRVRARKAGKVKIRVRRRTSVTHQFLLFTPRQLQRVPAPAGWMSPEGYRRYLRATLRKMRERQGSRGR